MHMHAPNLCRPLNGFYNTQENNGMPDNIRLYDIAVKVSPTQYIQYMQFTDNIQENNENPDTQLLHKP